ncbi:hypothetical protein L3Q82_007861 [Scortum barcoo]|uniref:Uncharacterized protein n=1 Tax=Scortum barcoo TaxID=214431 RepID=A0ACB8WK75_9TELE|nr:hypothetical protein L3Q82_007861 [Scortum barcoo]
MYYTKDTWDGSLSKELREDAIKLLEEYADLSQLRFIRPLTPPDRCARPSGITFSDSSEHAYGAVLYLRWSCSHGVVVKLVESKAKLTPLNHKGDPVKVEMCGAVFAARLKSYFQKLPNRSQEVVPSRKLARVVAVNPDSRGIVQDVHVKVSLSGFFTFLHYFLFTGLNKSKNE